MCSHLKAKNKSLREDGKGSQKVERKLKEHAWGAEISDTSRQNCPRNKDN
jgi:hypothetical protein